MNIQGFLDKFKGIQTAMLKYIDSDSSGDKPFNELNQILDNNKIHKDKKDLKMFLRLLSAISANHHRKYDFFDKIKSIILKYKSAMSKYFPNWEIFSIFKKDKMILLLLIKENILHVDQYVSKQLKARESNCYFFFPEIKKYLSKEKIREISSWIPDNFEEKRQKGVNDSYLSQIIRNDSLNEFISYINKKKSDFREDIESSYFETNQFLAKKYSLNLIEYAAFYGSVQIFKHLLKDYDNTLFSDIWLYAIHGNNTEIINCLSKKHVEEEYDKCFKESIKCHHNDIAKFIQNKNFKKIGKLHINCVKFYNFELITNELVNTLTLRDWCLFDYIKLVQILLDKGEIDPNAIII